MTTDDERSRLVFAGMLPPPVGGQSMATLQMNTLLTRRLDLRTFNLSPDNAESWSGRVYRIVLLLLGLIVERWRGTRSFYCSPYVGHGLWLCAVAFGLARLLGYRSWVHSHSYDPLHRRRGAMTLLTRLGGASVVHIVPTAATGEKFQRLYPAATRILVMSSAYLLSPAADSGSPTRGIRASGDPVRLGHLSNLTLAKGIDDVVACLAALKRATVPFTFDVAGPADDDASRLIAQARDAFPDVFTYRGPVYNTDKERFYASLEVFLMPSRFRHEMTPLALLEAMRDGLLCIVRDWGTMTDEVGKATIVVGRDENFAERVADTVSRLVAQPDLLADWSRRSKERYERLAVEGSIALDRLIEEIARAGAENKKSLAVQ